ncbi:hypothetical protein [Aquibacillus rhizosphaerae]|uniref:DUF3221 domain-containing protein n=1 Tax=Aquibacillus rhizosphaerae TaxID=3051431 RepID=A0ABT7L1C9_9BACI|nr:hypothetical protein [Aquibacillus sp. LR5S19]MDL4839658.1 hypothetical protein [Aquibacillus sp. LR5S19]
MKKINPYILFFFLLIGCSPNNTSNQTEQIIGEISSISDNVVTVDCSNEVNKTDDTWGYECPVKVTDETLLEEKGGKKLNIENFREGSIVEVILTSQKNLIEDAKPFRAKKVTVLSESE